MRFDTTTRARRGFAGFWATAALAVLFTLTAPARANGPAGLHFGDTAPPPPALRALSNAALAPATPPALTARPFDRYLRSQFAALPTVTEQGLAFRTALPDAGAERRNRA